MNASKVWPPRLVLALPRFVLHPLSATVIAAAHVYLASGHVSKLVAGHVEWTDLWKASGALAGAYVFAALATRRLAARGSKPDIAASQGIAS